MTTQSIVEGAGGAILPALFTPLNSGRECQMPKIRICKTAGCSNELTSRNHYCSRACQFLGKVDRSAGPDGCWIWKGHINPQTGYGQVTNTETAHRLSYRLHHNMDPGDLCVLHRCDVRTCVAPHHLFLGTKLENWHDSVIKGRQTAIVNGRTNTNAKLTTAEVLEIRYSPARGCDLALKFGVTADNVRKIRSMDTWKHIPPSSPGSDASEWVFLTGVMDRPSSRVAS